jgi:hypothetical protein
MLPLDDNLTFDVDSVKNYLTQKNINWYQLIASSAMGTNTQEYGMLYMPQSVTLSDMEELCDIMGDVSVAHIMTETEYQEYLDDAPTDAAWDVTIYGKETTYYGPAAKTTES